jgi:hypothetical protein
VKVFNISRGACIPFYEKLSFLSVPESRSPTHVPVSRNIRFRLVLGSPQFDFVLKSKTDGSGLNPRFWLTSCAHKKMDHVT